MKLKNHAYRQVRQALVHDLGSGVIRNLQMNYSASNIGTKFESNPQLADAWHRVESTIEAIHELAMRCKSIHDGTALADVLDMARSGHRLSLQFDAVYEPFMNALYAAAQDDLAIKDALKFFDGFLNAPYKDVANQNLSAAIREMTGKA